MVKDLDIIITNRSKLLSVDLHEVWWYRNLLSMYIKRDISHFINKRFLVPYGLLSNHSSPPSCSCLYLVKLRESLQMVSPWTPSSPYKTYISYYAIR